jgi:hypothetical protein
MKLKPTQKLIQIIVEDDTDELLLKMAKEDDRSRGSFIRVLIRDEFNRRYGGDGPADKNGQPEQAEDRSGSR